MKKPMIRGVNSNVHKKFQDIQIACWSPFQDFCSTDMRESRNLAWETADWLGGLYSTFKKMTSDNECIINGNKEELTESKYIAENTSKFHAREIN